RDRLEARETGRIARRLALHRRVERRFDLLRRALRGRREIAVADLPVRPARELARPRASSRAVERALGRAVGRRLELLLEQRHPEAAVDEVLLAHVALDALLQRGARG